MDTVSQRTERPEHAVSPCLTHTPYRMIVYIRHHNNTPLYQVAGVDASAMGAAKALKAALAKHGGTCFYCKKGVTAEDGTIDHVEAVARGGTSDLQNLLISCKPCNTAKGIKPIEFFKPEAGREWLSEVLAQVQDRLNRI